MLQITVRHCSQQNHSRWFVSVSTRGALSCFVVVSTKGGAVTGLCARQNEMGKLYGAPTGEVGGFFFPRGLQDPAGPTTVSLKTTRPEFNGLSIVIRTLV